MMDRIIKLLDSFKEIDDWKIVERDVEDQELFFVKSALDMNRAKQVKKFYVTVYKDFEEKGKKYRGSADFMIHSTMKSEEIKNIIKENIELCKFIKNPPYPIAIPAEEKSLVLPSAYSKGNLSEWIYRLSEEMYDVKNKDGWINSSEFFLSHLKMRIVNSKGVDVFNDNYNLYIEFVTTSMGDEEEVELYWDFENSDFESGMVSGKTLEALKLTHERSIAIPMPELKKIPVVLTGDAVSEFMKYYLYRSSAMYFYEHLSTSKVGDNLQGDHVDGDSITMHIDPFVKVSSYSASYDIDGMTLKKFDLIENGVMKRYWGDVRYSHYIGVEPTGHLTNFVVNGGKYSKDNLRSGRYLELLSFSDFQMDPVTGDFGGEVRLGRYCDGTRTIAVTGGSISGNVKDVQSELLLSKEIRRDKNFVGPECVKLFNVKIVGG